MNNTPTPEDIERLEKWCAARPPRVAELARRFPPWNCYRSKENPRMHYTIYSIGEPKEPDGPMTLTLVHGADSTLPGVSTFGHPEQLIVCNCGHWQPPTEAQQEAMREHLDALIRARSLAPKQPDPNEDPNKH